MSGLTETQARALHPETSVWVSASAGTGKTHVLTARVLKLMLRGTDPANILCITFTKAAAAEMKTRIFGELGRWLRMDDAELAKELHQRVDERADEEMLRLARTLFARVLDLPGGLRIQTIHSFCQSLLGRFPLEAELSPHFQVMDERTAAEFVREATEGLLVDARNAPGGRVARAIAHLAERVSEHVYEELMSAVIFERAHLARLFERHGDNLDGVIAATRRALGLGADETIAGSTAAATADRAMDMVGLRLLADGMANGSETEAGKAAVISAFLGATEEERTETLDDYLQVFLTGKLEPRKSVANKGTLEAEPRLEAIIADETARLLAFADRRRLLEAAINTEALLALAGAFLEHYRGTKVRHGLLDYDDLILKADRLLARNEIAPWILYKLDGCIDHVLVDEAQDTNPEQWRLVDVLSEEFFAGTGAREVIRTVFAVGDAKQSIFSFQRADPAEFQEARQRVRARAEQAGMHFAPVSLSLSFRSTRTVLDLVDSVFAQDPARDGLTPAPEEIRHAEQRREESGLVELWPTEPALEHDEDTEADWQPPVHQEQATSAEARLAVRIARRIDRMVSGNEDLKARGRPIRAGDILVLVRRRTAFAEHLLKALKARHIPVAGADRMVLTDGLAVRDLMALARFVLLPEDDLNLATVLKGPFVGIDEEALFGLAWNRGDASLWQRLVEDEAMKPAAAFLKARLARADFGAPYEFFSELLGPGGGRRQLTARLGNEINDPVDEFLSLALDFERTHTPSLQGFLAWLEAGNVEIKRDLEQGRNEVRIMTVHGAKGLQAPIVFLPDTCQVPQKRGPLLHLGGAESDDDAVQPLVWPGERENEAGPLAAARVRDDMARDAEYRRLLYVALTRAEDRLYIAGWETRNSRPETCWYDLVANGFGALEGVESVDDPDGGRVLRREDEGTRVRGKETKDVPVAAPVPKAPVWAAAPAPAEPLPPRPLAPSRPDDAEQEIAVSPRQRSSMSGAREAALSRGRIIHKLLEILPEAEPADRERLTRDYLARVAPGMPGPDADDIWRRVSRILDDAAFAPLFGPGSRAEVPLAGVLGDRVIAGEIDRLVIAGDEILVVDYKTNRPPPARAEDVPGLYLEQMAAYCAVLREIYPNKAIRAALLWTESAELMPLPEELLTAKDTEWRS